MSVTGWRVLVLGVPFERGRGDWWIQNDVAFVRQCEEFGSNLTSTSGMCFGAGVVGRGDFFGGHLVGRAGRHSESEAVLRRDSGRMGLESGG